MSKEEPTDLDHKGAVIWMRCPTCGADKYIPCSSIPVFGNLGPGKAHVPRVLVWLDFKAKVIAATNSRADSTNHINIQQIPRSEPHRVSKGVTKEGAEYWKRRNAIKPRDK